MSAGTPTEILIGGRLEPTDLEELATLIVGLDLAPQGDDADLDFDLSARIKDHLESSSIDEKPALFEGETFAGGFVRLRDWCIERKLTLRVVQQYDGDSWITLIGPNTDEPSGDTCMCDGDGEPAMSLASLQEAESFKQGLHNTIEELKRFEAERVPPLVLGESEPEAVGFSKDAIPVVEAIDEAEGRIEGGEPAAAVFEDLRVAVALAAGK